MLACFVLWLMGCGGSSTADTGAMPSTSSPTGVVSSSMPTLWLATGCTGTEVSSGNAADVEGVSTSGGPQAWSVAVTVRSPDEDCDQYADWWEIVSPEGELLYRRILNHSHADEQPFTRASEGVVPLDGDTEVLVRAHLHPFGFGGQVMQGTLAGAFRVATDLPDDFAADLATEAPLPEECWF